MIPVSEPLLDGNEKRYLAECIDSGWISSEGPFVARFESALAARLGVAHGVAVCNGTAALETALYALGVGRGDEVVMPSFTIISCALAAIRLGAKPVLVDVDPANWCMDTAAVASRLSARTKVVMPVHIYGHPVDMDPLLRLRESHGFKILEDAAEVHGAAYFSKYLGSRWVECGAMGDAAATSFYANKIVTTGEGGMVLSNDATVAERARSYRNLCFRPEQRFFHTELGYNFRLTNLQAAVGLAQVERLDEFIRIKVRLAECYRRWLAAIPGVRFMPVSPWAKSVYWMYAIELDPAVEVDAKVVMERLRAKGVATRPFFLGLHEQVALRELGLFAGEVYPRTEGASRRGLYLPSGLTLTESMVEKVVTALQEVLQ
ncbi:MAG: DegT/DnrJ/EryC1/StrS family aminotransferase [Opitutaceae bacterium]